MTTTSTVPAAASGTEGRPGAVEIARALGRPEPTPEQVAVIEAPVHPLLVVAGAGSGKTETMAARVVWLVAGGDVAPDEVLGLTFTRKAAGELSERIRSRLRALRRSGLWVPGTGDDAPAPIGSSGPGGGVPGVDGDLDVTVSTYHAYAGRLVREHGLRLGVEPEARLLTEAACWQLASEVVERWRGDMDAVEVMPSTVTEAVLQLAGEAAEHLVDLDDVDAYLAARVEQVAALPYNDAKVAGRYAPITTLLGRLEARRQLLPLVAAYREAKALRDSLDFGDQLRLAAELARQVPQLAVEERGRSRVVLLDEFQDTSHAQLVMLHALFGDGHAVTAVGDPNQSIYGWRGASAGTLATFADRFRDVDGGPATVRQLSTSWRNDRAVLEVANRLAAPLREGADVEVHPLVARPGAGSGHAELATYPTSQLEARGAVDWLAERWLGPDGRPVPGRSAAVLCRRRAQFADVEAALLRRGLPYQVVGLGGLLSTPEVADLLSALHVVHDPSRGDLLVRLLTGPTCRLGAHDLVVLGAWSAELARRRSGRPGGGHPVARDGAGPGGEPAQADVVDEASLVEAVDELPPEDWRDRDGRSLGEAARRRVERLASTVRGLRGRTALALPDLVAEVERALLLDVELASRPGVGPAQARAHLDAIAQVAADFASSAEHATLGAFLSWLEAADEQERGLEPGQVEVDDQVVQVMTVHAAKGLEWDVVAVPGLVEGAFPQHLQQPRPPGDDEPSWAIPTVKQKAWLGDLGAVPHALRGDVQALPDVRWSAAPHQAALRDELAVFEVAAGAHQVAEERRLVYVACTRARSHLLLTAHVWGSAKMPRLPSRFLLELAPALADGGLEPATGLGHVVQVDVVAGMPVPGDERPDDGRPTEAPWPGDRLGERRRHVETAADRVRAAREPLRAERVGRRAGLVPDDATARPGDGSSGDGLAPELPLDELLPLEAVLPVDLGVHAPVVDERQVDLLLAERDAGRDTRVEVALPTHLSASRLVRLAADRDALALSLRRPVPREPHPATRRGTAFHAWVERYLGSAAMVDVLDLPGAADDEPAPDEALAAMQQRFLASEWAQRRVLAVEVALETPVDGTVLRGRVDAVFARLGPDGRPDGGVDVVDWKTGPPPSGREAAARAVQLATYRLAWHRLHDVPLDQVGAAFFYACTGTTVRPADLLDEAGLVALLRTFDGEG
ncbi:ATP-dependent helicase [Angustibacter aerolatus]